MRLRTFAIITSAAVVAIPAIAQQTVGALQNHQALMGERATVHDCDSYYGSFMVRNSMPTTRRMQARRLCRQAAAAAEREREGLAMVGAPAAAAHPIAAPTDSLETAAPCTAHRDGFCPFRSAPGAVPRP